MPAGVDEAGRGPVLGPLVVAAVSIPREDELAALGVDDSKKLTPARREELATLVRGCCRVAVEMVTAEDIDSWREHRSLNALEVDLFARVLLALVREAGEEALTGGIYLDAADVNEERFGLSVLGRIEDGGVHPPGVTSKHKGDSLFPVVSAASIVAKVERDREMKRIGEEAREQVGSGYPSDPVTRAYLRGYVSRNGALPPHTRRSWETARELLRELTVRSPSLDEFR